MSCSCGNPLTRRASVTDSASTLPRAARLPAAWSAHASGGVPPARHSAVNAMSDDRRHPASGSDSGNAGSSGDDGPGGSGSSGDGSTEGDPSEDDGGSDREGSESDSDPRRVVPAQ